MQLQPNNIDETRVDTLYREMIEPLEPAWSHACETILILETSARNTIRGCLVGEKNALDIAITRSRTNTELHVRDACANFVKALRRIFHIYRWNVAPENDDHSILRFLKPTDDVRHEHDDHDEEIATA